MVELLLSYCNVEIKPLNLNSPVFPNVMTSTKKPHCNTFLMMNNMLVQLYQLFQNLFKQQILEQKSVSWLSLECTLNVFFLPWTVLSLVYGSTLVVSKWWAFGDNWWLWPCRVEVDIWKTLIKQNKHMFFLITFVNR